jgi:hypothetical protein
VKTILKNDKVCIITNIDSIEKKYLYNSVQENLNRNYTEDCNLCDYVLIINPVNFNYPLADITGAQMQKNINININSSVLKIDRQYQQNFCAIFNNEDNTVLSFEEEYTGAKFKGIGRKVIREHEAAQQQNASYTIFYNTIIAKLRERHKFVSSYNIVNNQSYMATPTILTSEYQSKIDTLEFMYKKSGYDIYNLFLIHLQEFQNNDKSSDEKH